MNLEKISNNDLLQEISNRFIQRDATISEGKVMMKKLEEINKKLSKAEENRSKFMSIIKNEFNNPLATMMSLSKSLLKSTEDDKIQMIGRLLHEESLLLNFQIKNVIVAAEIESGTLDVQTSKIDFNDVILQITEELQYQIKHKAIKLDINIFADNDIYLDREKLYLILVNLISNSVEFSPNNSKIDIEVFEDLNNVSVLVRDYGEGIGEAEYPNIFKRFYQAHSGMNRMHRGQGLGLSVVQDLVEVQNGTVEFKSIPMEVTTFEVKLPKAIAQESSLFGDDDMMFEFDTDDKAF